MSDLKLNRSDVMKRIMDVRNNALVITGLGSPVWDLAASDHRPENFYSWGGMGCAISMGLGCALAQADRKVWVITGDGEALMGVGSLATVAAQRPTNLAIIVLDNEHYGETGFQRSHTGLGTDLAAMAQGAGIGAVRTVREMAELDEAGDMLRQSNGAAFVLLKVAVDDPPKVRIHWDAAYHKNRFRQALLGQP